MTTLSEAESLQLVADAGVPVVPERVCARVDQAVAAGREFGYPVVCKLTGAGIAHKMERGLVRLALDNDHALHDAAGELLAAARPEDGDVALLVAPMLRATRELIAGVHHDEQFGPCVMIGIGGVLTEALADVAFRLVPIEPVDALDMLDDLRTQALLAPVRGEPAVDRGAVAEVLVALSGLAATRRYTAIDLNPLLIVDGRPIAVDALVEPA